MRFRLVLAGLLALVPVGAWGQGTVDIGGLVTNAPECSLSQLNAGPPPSGNCSTLGTLDASDIAIVNDAVSAAASATAACDTANGGGSLMLACMYSEVLSDWVTIGQVFGGGESTTAINVGAAGVGVFSDQNAAELRFAKLVQGANCTIVPSGTPVDQITISCPTLIEEEVEDFVGSMLGGTETGISVTYVDGGDGTGSIDFVVDYAAIRTQFVENGVTEMTVETLGTGCTDADVFVALSGGVDCATLGGTDL